MEKKKKYLLGIGIFILLLCMVGVSYAYWTINLQQTGENDLTSSCFKVSLTEEANPIQLLKAYPILDSEAETLVPYTFKIENQCDAAASYQINLEILDETDLDTQYVKYMLNETSKDKTEKFLNDQDSSVTTLLDASNAFKLETGYLDASGTKTYELRLYLDGELTISDKEAMNKTFLSKITITASYAKETLKTLEETILALPKKTEDSGDNGLYEVSHENAKITYTSNQTLQNRLKEKEYRYAGVDPDNYVSFGETVTEDKYEMFIEAMGDSLPVFLLSDQLPGLDVPQSFSTEEECNTKAADETVKGIIESAFYQLELTLKCEKTEEVGDPIYWRIIGLVNTPEGQRMKLIRYNSIGQYSWDSSESTVNKGLGVNEWKDSDIEEKLNSEFYESLPENLQAAIVDTTWNLGSVEDENTQTLLVSQFYEAERSQNNGNICQNGEVCNDNVDRTISWKGKVGLMYPSDYGYATAGENDDTRTSCLQKPLAPADNYNGCHNTNWVLNSITSYTMMPAAHSKRSNSVFQFETGDTGTELLSVAASSVGYIQPCIYLSSHVVVKEGNGKIKTPYVLALY